MITFRGPNPIPLSGCECKYCGGTLLGTIRQETSKVKRQPPLGAVDLNLYDEHITTYETYTCERCKAVSTSPPGFSYTLRESLGLVVKPCCPKTKECILPEQALTLPLLPLKLVTHKDKNGFGENSPSEYFKCTSCLPCHVCGQPLQSREIVYVWRSKYVYPSSRDNYSTDHYYYAHNSCGVALLDKVTKDDQASSKVNSKKRFW